MRTNVISAQNPSELIESLVMQFVYVLTTEGADAYVAMTRVSLASIRCSNPGLPVTVVCDRQSARHLRQCRSPLLGEVDDLIDIPAPEGDPGFVNRFVKTQVRTLIEGPLLFLDSDTFVRKPLNDFCSVDADVALAKNHSQQDFSKQVWDQDSRVLEHFGWATRKDAYFNGGVTLYNETPAAHRFAEVWHRLYREAYRVTQRHRDQPALNTALQESGVRCCVLDHEYNAQFRANPAVCYDGAIWHYYSSQPQQMPTQFEMLCERILGGGTIRAGEIRSMCRCRHPFPLQRWTNDYFSRRIAAREEVDEISACMIGGNRREAAMCLMDFLYRRAYRPEHYAGAGP